MSSLMRRRSRALGLPGPEPGTSLLEDEDSRLSSIPDTFDSNSNSLSSDFREDVVALSSAVDRWMAKAIIQGVDDPFTRSIKDYVNSLNLKSIVEDDKPLPALELRPASPGKPAFTSTPGLSLSLPELLEVSQKDPIFEKALLEHQNSNFYLRLGELRNENSCASSECSEFVGFEDGRLIKRRKKKKRNLTGWPSCIGRPKKRAWMKRPGETKIVIKQELVETGEDSSVGAECELTLTAETPEMSCELSVPRRRGRTPKAASLSSPRTTRKTSTPRKLR